MADSLLLNHDVPCAVCRAPKSSVMMIPGSHLCLEGWTQEYSGLLAAGYYGHPAASEFVCLDDQPESMHGGENGDEEGKYFFFAEAVCGSMRCGPYVAGRELTCAVCTR